MTICQIAQCKKSILLERGRENLKYGGLDKKGLSIVDKGLEKWELVQDKKEILLEKGREKYNKTVGRPTKDDKSLSIVDNDKHNTRDEIAKDLGWSTGKTTSCRFGKTFTEDTSEKKLRI